MERDLRVVDLGVIEGCLVREAMLVVELVVVEEVALEVVQEMER